MMPRPSATAISGYEAAVASGAPANVAARFTTDGTFNTPKGIFQGRAALAQYNMGRIKPRVKDSDTLEIARYVAGVVLCSGGFTFTLAPGGPMKEIGGNWTKVLTKSGKDVVVDLNVRDVAGISISSPCRSLRGIVSCVPVAK